MNWINKMFCDPNGIPDDARISAFLLVMSYIALAIIDVGFHKASFHYQDFGTGAGLLAVGVGGWFKLRDGQ